MLIKKKSNKDQNLRDFLLFIDLFDLKDEVNSRHCKFCLSLIKKAKLKRNFTINV